MLITNSIGENENGIATVGGVCSVDLTDLEDLGAVVVYDRGLYKSMGIAAHEIGHSYKGLDLSVELSWSFAFTFRLGAEHDDPDEDEDRKFTCPEGFLMNSVAGNNVFFFSNCSDIAISRYVK